MTARSTQGQAPSATSPSWESTQLLAGTPQVDQSVAAFHFLEGNCRSDRRLLDSNLRIGARCGSVVFFPAADRLESNLGIDEFSDRTGDSILSDRGNPAKPANDIAFVLHCGRVRGRAPETLIVNA